MDGKTGPAGAAQNDNLSLEVILRACDFFDALLDFSWGFPPGCEL